MTHYLDIHLLPDPEFAPPMLLGALLTKLHRALVQQAANDVAISLPGYDLAAGHLGNTLRLLAPAGPLDKLMAQNWLQGMQDHVSQTALQAVPQTGQHITLRRVQAKSNPERLRRRQMKRHGLTEAQARERIPDSAAELLRLPYVALRSASTGQAFRLYLRQSAVLNQAQPGEFNSYGLSSTGTVPWFC